MSRLTRDGANGASRTARAATHRETLDARAPALGQVDLRFGLNIYFSDFFSVTEEALEEYGAFNISLVTDLPLFIDPFLLFNSHKPEYQALHDDIIRYLRFLRAKSEVGLVSPGLIKAWYVFSEVKQTWLGFCDLPGVSWTT